jgi:hypothetical protein
MLTRAEASGSSVEEVSVRCSAETAFRSIISGTLDRWATVAEAPGAVLYALPMSSQAASITPRESWLA